MLALAPRDRLTFAAGLVLMTGLLLAAGHGGPQAPSPAGPPSPTTHATEKAPPAPPQGYPYHAYDGSWTFVRIQTGGSGFRRAGGWAHDYPDAERNLTRILREVTSIRARLVPSGGNVLTFDDPRLFHFPIAYVSEPDEWRVSAREAEGLRIYLLKGGFVIFDDFFSYEMANLVAQMRRVFPELAWLRMDGSEPVWDSFFGIDPTEVYLTGPRKQGTPDFWGLYLDNDPGKRLLAIAGAGGDIGDLWEWSAEGFYPLDPTNEAFRIGVNYITYALTH